MANQYGKYVIHDFVFEDINHDSYRISIPSLDIFAYGTTRDEAVKDLIDELDYAYDHYAIGDQSKLNDKAKEYGNELLKKIKVTI